MEFVESFKELNVYNRARKLAQEIFKMTEEFPDEEKYSLTDQIRCSSRSIGAQIAESWGHRRYVKSFKSKLTDAYGEASETVHWLDTVKDCEYGEHDRCDELIRECREIQSMINSMIHKADSFCDSIKDT